MAWYVTRKLSSFDEFHLYSQKRNQQGKIRRNPEWRICGPCRVRMRTLQGPQNGHLQKVFCYGHIAIYQRKSLLIRQNPIFPIFEVSIGMFLLLILVVQSLPQGVGSWGFVLPLMATALSPVIGFVENGFWVLGWPLPSSHGASPKRIISSNKLL